jgi:hypothetical protein
VIQDFYTQSNVYSAERHFGYVKAWCHDRSDLSREWKTIDQSMNAVMMDILKILAFSLLFHLTYSVPG